MTGMAPELLRIEKSIVLSRPLRSESIHRHPGLRRVTNFRTMTSSEDLSI
jgi:hypothetical protein